MYRSFPCFCSWFVSTRSSVFALSDIPRAAQARFRPVYILSFLLYEGFISLEGFALYIQPSSIRPPRKRAVRLSSVAALLCLRSATSITPIYFFVLVSCLQAPSRLRRSPHESESQDIPLRASTTGLLAFRLRAAQCCQYSGGSSSISSQRNTGPSLQTYLEPMLQRPHLPTPHFMRSSSVVYT